MSVSALPTVTEIEIELLDLLVRLVPAVDLACFDRGESLVDAGVTSMQTILLAYEAEDRYGIDLSAAGYERLTSIRDSALVIHSLLATKEGSRP